jgi:hypothetical protein
LGRAGKAACALRLTFECENGGVREMDVGFAQATGDARTMLDVMRAKLEGLSFESPICGLRMQAMRLEECGTIATLFAQNEADPQALAVALARLEAVTGNAPHRARVRPAHCFEARFGYEKYMPLAHYGKTAVEKRHVPQLRLLAVKEIDVRVRGNMPVKVDRRSVVDCAGPWRVDDGWFDSPMLRDEYDVLLDDGMLCRIYRQGEHWYLRGAYD